MMLVSIYGHWPPLQRYSVGLAGRTRIAGAFGRGVLTTMSADGARPRRLRDERRLASARDDAAGAAEYDDRCAGDTSYLGASDEDYKI